MQNSNETQCQTIQIQIDSYLDGELQADQQQLFLAHCGDCSDCQDELRIARVIHDGIESLPVLDCPDSLLHGLHQESEKPGFFEALSQLLVSMPVFLRYSLPALLVAALAVGLGDFNFSQQPQVAEEQYSVEEIRRALDDFNLAIEYLNEVSQRTEVMIGDRFLIAPLQDSLNASMQSIQDVRNDPTIDDPI